MARGVTVRQHMGSNNPIIVALRRLAYTDAVWFALQAVVFRVEKLGFLGTLNILFSNPIRVKVRVRVR